MEYQRKDALTDLIQDLSSNRDQQNQPKNDGQIMSSDQEVVQLGYESKSSEE